MLQFEALDAGSGNAAHLRQALGRNLLLQTASLQILCQPLHGYLQRIRIEYVFILHHILCVNLPFGFLYTIYYAQRYEIIFILPNFFPFILCKEAVNSEKRYVEGKQEMFFNLTGLE